jgi:hypothetical protein
MQEAPPNATHWSRALMAEAMGTANHKASIAISHAAAQHRRLSNHQDGFLLQRRFSQHRSNADGARYPKPIKLVLMCVHMDTRY